MSGTRNEQGRVSRKKPRRDRRLARRAARAAKRGMRYYGVAYYTDALSVKIITDA